MAKGGLPYAGQTERAIAERILEHGDRVRRLLATIHVDGAALNKAEQFFIDIVKRAVYQDIQASLGRSNPANSLANRRNEIKALVGKALPMCK